MTPSERLVAASSTPCRQGRSSYSIHDCHNVCSRLSLKTSQPKTIYCEYDSIAPSKIFLMRNTYSITRSNMCIIKSCKHSRTSHFLLKWGMPVTIPASTAGGLGNKTQGGQGGTKIFLPEPLRSCINQQMSSHTRQSVDCSTKIFKTSLWLENIVDFRT